MNIPFTIEQFLLVMQNYNLAVWPFQIVLNLLALTTIILSLKKTNATDKINSSILAFLWIWIGIAYHLIHFTVINKAAYLFAILNVGQGFIFIYAGVLKDKISFRFTSSVYSAFGWLFIVYALILYPILGHILGHIYPESPTFGLPCPTTIFTFGILLFTDKRLPKYILVIPFLWSIIGFSAAINLLIYEDFGLAIAGILGVILIYLRDRNLAGTNKK
jgi:hypothetical protein